jgi:hypothetical protein
MILLSTDFPMQVVAGIVPFAVHMTNAALGPTENELESGFMQARSVNIQLSII